MSSPATTCPLIFSYNVVDSTGADRTASLSSFITATPVTTTPGYFIVSVLASTDTTIASKSPYIVTLTAALTDSPSVVQTDTFTLTIKNSCVTSSILPTESITYDWVL